MQGSGAIIEGPGFCIRPVGVEALRDILEVYRQCEDFLALGPVAQASEKMVLVDLEHSRKAGGVFCGIYHPEQGVMMGILDFIPRGFANNRHSALLELLMIGAPYRRCGLGEKVVRALEAYIWRDAAITEIRSGVQVNNPGAIRFWQRMGYAIVSEARDMGDGTTAFELWKPAQAGA